MIWGSQMQKLNQNITLSHLGTSTKEKRIQRSEKRRKILEEFM